jgi:hypothetical protein
VWPEPAIVNLAICVRDAAMTPGQAAPSRRCAVPDGVGVGVGVGVVGVGVGVGVGVAPGHGQRAEKRRSLRGFAGVVRTG